MKIFSFIILAVFLFTGCVSSKQDCIKEPPIIIQQTKEVKTIVKSPRPKINCNLDTPEGYLDCIILQKRVIEKLTVPGTENKEEIVEVKITKDVK